MYPDPVQPGAARVSFSSGPNIFTWVAILFAAILALVSALKAWMPTAPPAAQLAGGAILAAAEAQQRQFALGGLVVGLIALAWLAKWRRCVIDFEAEVIEATTLAAIGFGRRRIPFAELSHAETRHLHRDAVTLWGLTIHPLRGKSIRLGLVAVDWGAADLAERLNAAIQPARGQAKVPTGAGRTAAAG